MRFFSIIPAITPILLVAGCVTDPYNVPSPGPATAIEEPEDGRYTVTYRGAPNATPARVRELALLRAATITLQKNGTWFEIVTDYARTENEKKTVFELDPFSQSGVTRANCGVLGCPSTARPDDILGQRDIDPKAAQRSYTIQSFEIIVNSGERPLGKENTYDALEVSNEMRRRYSDIEQ